MTYRMSCAGDEEVQYVMVILPSHEAALATAGMELVLEVRGAGRLGVATCDASSSAVQPAGDEQQCSMQ
jgi:hypothetical protein